MGNVPKYRIIKPVLNDKKREIIESMKQTAIQQNRLQKT